VWIVFEFAQYLHISAVSLSYNGISCAQIDTEIYALFDVCALIEGGSRAS
jgi:hypothetical protein